MLGIYSKILSIRSLELFATAGRAVTRRCYFVFCVLGWVRRILVVRVLACQSLGSGIKPRPGQKFGSRFLFHLRRPTPPIANLAMMSTLTTHCQWEDEMVSERTGHGLPSYVVAKNMR